MEGYLEKLSTFVGDDYGRQYRNHFKDMAGSSELGMLAAPTREEYEELKKAVAIMTSDEKKNAAKLTDDQVARIAEDAKIDPGKFAIFINGFALESRKE